MWVTDIIEDYMFSKFYQSKCILHSSSYRKQLFLLLLHISMYFTFNYWSKWNTIRYVIFLKFFTLTHFAFKNIFLAKLFLEIHLLSIVLSKLCLLYIPEQVIYKYSCNMYHVFPPTAVGLCSCFGDPHCISFDQKWLHFQGDCQYVMSQDGCHGTTPTYQVLTTHWNQNRPEAAHVTWVKTVTVILPGYVRTSWMYSKAISYRCHLCWQIVTRWDLICIN